MGKLNFSSDGLAWRQSELEPAQVYEGMESADDFSTSSSTPFPTPAQQPVNYELHQGAHTIPSTMKFTTTFLTAILASFVAGLETSNGPLTAEADAAKLVQCVDELKDSRK